MVDNKFRLSYTSSFKILIGRKKIGEKMIEKNKSKFIENIFS
jgi:hypothetical protein